jgi:hypothetical protein
MVGEGVRVTGRFGRLQEADMTGRRMAANSRMILAVVFMDKVPIQAASAAFVVGAVGFIPRRMGWQRMFFLHHACPMMMPGPSWQ